MLVVEGLGEREAPAVDDGGVVAVVADDEVVAGQQLRDDSGIDREAGREAERFVLANKSREFFLELDMDVKRTIEETGTGTSGTVLAQGFHSGLDDALVAGKARVCVGTEHEDFVAVHFDLGSLLAYNLAEIGINPFLHHSLRQIVLCQSFL